jgi:hypothetical protein
LFSEDPRLTHLKNIINSEEKYLESLRVTVEVYGEVLKYVLNETTAYVKVVSSYTFDRHVYTDQDTHKMDENWGQLFKAGLTLILG